MTGCNLQAVTPVSPARHVTIFLQGRSGLIPRATGEAHDHRIRSRAAAYQAVPWHRLDCLWREGQRLFDLSAALLQSGHWPRCPAGLARADAGAVCRCLCRSDHRPSQRPDLYKMGQAPPLALYCADPAGPCMDYAVGGAGGTGRLDLRLSAGDRDHGPGAGVLLRGTVGLADPGTDPRL